MTTQAYPRVTVAAVVRHQGRYLLVEEESRGRRRLNQPAGHLEPGESLLEAAVRETREEAGAEITPNALLGIYQWQAPHNGRRVVRFTFAADLESIDPGATLDVGIIRTVWLSRSDLEASEIPHRSPMVLRGVADFESGIRYPLGLVRPLPPL